MKRIIAIIALTLAASVAHSKQVIDAEALATSQGYTAEAEKFFQLAKQCRESYHSLERMLKDKQWEASLSMKRASYLRSMRLFEDAENEMAVYQEIMEEANEYSKQMSRASSLFYSCRDEYIKNRALSEKFRCQAYGEVFVPHPVGYYCSNLNLNYRF